MSNLPHSLLTTYLQQHDLSAAYDYVQQHIRSEPGVLSHRWALFQLYCLESQWHNALKQLQVCARLESKGHADIYTMRTLIECEYMRDAVFQGKGKPGYLSVPLPYMSCLLDALQHNVAGDVARADETRLQAFEQMSDYSGRIEQEAFQMIVDKDTRLSGVVELYTQGGYRWGSWGEICILQFAPPATLLDLIWRKCTGTFKNGQSVHGFMPVRYPMPVDEETVPTQILQARLTTWHTEGETLVYGIGQRMWMTDAGEYPLLECHTIVLD